MVKLEKYNIALSKMCYKTNNQGNMAETFDLSQHCATIFRTILVGV